MWVGRAGRRSSTNLTCYAEVGEQGTSPGIEKNVARLDIAMDDATAVDHVQPIGNLQYQPARLGRVHPSFTPSEVTKRFVQ
jgi:hypothetical protein